jgi:hypothetical protein
MVVRSCGAAAWRSTSRPRRNYKLDQLNQIWELDADFTNYFLPQQKLIFKQRNGAKVTKPYDTATTSHRRAIDHETVRKRPKITMNARFKRLKPGALSRQILAKTGELETGKCSFRLH